MESSALRRCCIILGFVLFFLARESYTLQCYHCGFSREHYQKWQMDMEHPYPIARDKTWNNTIPENETEVQKKCMKQPCEGQNSACLKWSFISNHPINITYMCTGNPSNHKGCYKQDIPGKYFLKLVVCLCRENLCNSGVYSSTFPIVTLAGIILVSFFKSFSLR